MKNIIIPTSDYKVRLQIDKVITAGVIDNVSAAG